MTDETPMSVGDCVGSTWAVAWAGKTYTLGRPTPAVLADIETEIGRDVWEEAKALRDVAPELVAEAKDALLARHHRVGGPLWDATFKTAAAQFLQLWALVKAHHPEFTRADAVAMFRDVPDDCEVALVAIAPDFFAEVAERAKTPHAAAATGVERARGKAAAALAGRGR